MNIVRRQIDTNMFCLMWKLQPLEVELRWEIQEDFSHRVGRLYVGRVVILVASKLPVVYRL